MKTSVLTLLALMLLFGTAATAETKDVVRPEKSTEAALILKNGIRYPFLAEYRNISGTVVFELRSIDKNNLEFVPLAADNPLLFESVEKQVKKMKSRLAKAMEPGKSEQFKLTFTILE